MCPIRLFHNGKVKAKVKVKKKKKLSFVLLKKITLVKVRGKMKKCLLVREAVFLLKSSFQDDKDNVDGGHLA